MLTEEQIQRYNQDGFAVVKQLLSLKECEKLKSVAHQLIDEWQPETDYSWIFPNVVKDGKSAHQFLLDSINNISFFIEKGAVDRDTGKLNRNKHLSVSRIGHGLHILQPEFKKVAFSDKIKGIVRDLNFIKPIMRQTLFIFKQPFIGDQINIHRDSELTYNDPCKIVAVWIALEDVTLENGCLWFIPGSHSKTAQRRFMRNPNEQEFNEGGKKFIYSGEQEQFDESALIPVPVKAGDAILIHGDVVHKSEQNKSSVSRQSYIMHILEMQNAVYCKENWLQSPTPFPLVYDE